MSFEQPVTAAEAELERLLAIEPSIGFRARVRERVASESVGAHRLPWRLAFATAGVLIAAAAGLLMNPADVRRPPAPRAPRPALNALHQPDAVPFGSAGARELGNSELGLPAVARSAKAGWSAARGMREPEVVWDARSADAIARVVELARRGTVVTVPKARETSPLAVQPLLVAPITTDLLILPTESERSSS